MRDVCSPWGVETPTVMTNDQGTDFVDGLAKVVVYGKGLYISPQKMAVRDMAKEA